MTLTQSGRDRLLLDQRRKSTRRQVTLLWLAPSPKNQPKMMPYRLVSPDKLFEQLTPS
jgi:hypothetical protein